MSSDTKKSIRRKGKGWGRNVRLLFQYIILSFAAGIEENYQKLGSIYPLLY
jgi:hypothetical protein